MHDSFEMSRHRGTQRFGIGDVDYKVRIAAARDQSVPFDQHVMFIGEVNETVDRIPVVMAW